MFKGPHFLNWACPAWSLLQQRESHFPALFHFTAVALHGSKTVKKRRFTRCHQMDRSQFWTSTFGGLLNSSNMKPFCDLPPKAHFCSQHESGIVLEADHKQWKSTVAKAYNGYTLCIQSHRKPWFIQQHCSFCDLHKPNYLCLGPTSTRLFSSSVSNTSIFHNFIQIRPVHTTVPYEDSVWRDCLSYGNEQRCRQILEPNLKLYEGEKVHQGPSLSLGKKQARWASVLVSLCSVKDEPAILFTLRSSTLKGRHKGDVSFAGGKSDPSDKDVISTALREAREELGINVRAEQVWGVLKPLREMTGMMVAPVLANLGPLEELSFKPNPGEVEEIFTLSLSHLCNPQNRGYTHFRTGNKYGYTLPVFRNGKHKVWGLTATALDHTLKIICQR